MAKVVKRAFRYRCYPTADQEAELLRTFGCVRKVYNLALQARSEAWRIHQRRVNYAQTSGLLTEWKKTDELAFLNEVSSVPLRQCLRHLQTAFVAFWDKRSAYPRFKARKRGTASAEYTRSAFAWRDGRLTLAKMSHPLPILWSRPLPDGAEPSTVTITLDPAGRWHVSILTQATVDSLPPIAAQVGVDLGLRTLLTLSTGEKTANPRFAARAQRRLARAQRTLARKQKGSTNRAKASRQLARIHARIADRRRDHLHKVTTRLVRDNQTIVIEDLAVRNMMGNRRLARVISDANWAEFRSMVEYKTNWYGRQLIVLDRWYPSSKTCSNCGHLLDRMPLAVREWTCRCGAVHDRDVNAARNILAAGLAASACGGGVRPIQQKLERQRPAKQETRPARVGIPRLHF